jgi:RNA polymerase sigma-70 factor (ECF subfamily)
MASRQFDDEQLIKQVKNGDAEAFGVLYDQYAELIFRYVYSHLESRLDAEDLTEEIFVRAWRALPKYDDRGLPFSAFLFRVARNSLIDYYRQRKVVQSIDDMELQSHEAGPEEAVDIRIENSDLRKTIAELREDYRNVLIFRFLSGLSPEETAQVMQRSIGAVRVLQHRALSALKELLERGSRVRTG